MERTRIAKVEQVKLIRRGQQVQGTLHLTPHHIIFIYIPPPPPLPDGQQVSAPLPPKPKELWITYPIIQTCTLRLSAQASHIPSSIRMRCRDFTFICFCFHDDSKAQDVFDSIKAWTCKLGRVDKLYAFAYQPQSPEREVNGWAVYDARTEWRRQGISEKSSDKGWRISTLNHDYNFSPTYPALLPVPSTISDNTLNYAGRFRSRIRLPVLTYLHPVNNCSITRCSQPLVGVRQNRSIQDEKLLLAIFSTTKSQNNYADSEQSLSGSQTPHSNDGNLPGINSEASFTESEALEDELIASTSNQGSQEHPQIYGAQQHNLIVDARPTVNAYAMQAVGMGTEHMDNYPFATKAYLGIDNIHVMRDSLQKVVDALKESDLTPLGPNRDVLAKSGWLKHIANMLDGVGLITRQIGIQHSHVLIHCSDGWDRTSQLSSLSQICLDPYFRTLDGFMVLVEKDWLSFGHMFAHRTGHLSSEKWFSIENERITPDSNRNPGQGTGAQSALENAFLSAKGFFKQDNNRSRESLADSDSEMNPMDPEYTTPKKTTSTIAKNAPTKHTTKVKETAPIFHQFLDAAYQLLCQYPTRFEFNERFLRRLLYHIYSCQYGTFLFNSEKERKDARVQERTRSVWDYFLSRREQWLNPEYVATIDDKERGMERLIFPKPGQVKWWHELFGRTDVEMNGPLNERQQGENIQQPPIALTGVVTAQQAIEPVAVDNDIGNSQNSLVTATPDAQTSSLAKGVHTLRLGSSTGTTAAKDKNECECAEGSSKTLEAKNAEAIGFEMQ